MPQQARAQVTYEAILDGAIRVLDQNSGTEANTKRIAEAAGVSVGTLYQYFSDRDAIIDALQDREFSRASTMLQERLSEDSTRTAKDVARSVVGGLLALYRQSPGLHRLLAVDGLRVAPTERVMAFDRKVVDTLRGFFELSGLPIVRKNKSAAAFVLYQSVRATLLAAILEEPSGMTDDGLIHELSELCESYLLGSCGET